MKNYIRYKAGRQRYLSTALFAALLSVALMFIFTGCKPDGNPEDVSATSEETTAEPEPLPTKVGFIYNGGLDGGTINRIFDNARVQLESNLGVETCYIEGVLVGDFSEAVDTLVDHKVTVIVSCNDAFASSCRKAADMYPDIKFINYGGDIGTKNLTSFAPLLYQPANVCGLAAYINSNSPTFGIVADHRMYNCLGVIDAYILGIKTFPQADFSVRVNWASSDRADDTQAAIDDLVKNGADTIMIYQSTDYGIKYCEKKGIKVIAFAGDLPYLAHNNYITGFYFNVNSYITEQVRFIQNESFVGLATFGEMNAGYTRMTQLNGSELVVRPETYDLVKKLYENVEKSDGIFVGEIKDNFALAQVPKGVILDKRDVLKINWLEISAGSNIKSFSEPYAEWEIIPSDFIVRGERPETEAPKTTAPASETSGKSQ